MKIGLVLGSLLIATTAYAQAPGDYAAEDSDLAPPGMAPSVEPVVVAAPPERPLRWSVGLSFGSMGVAPHHQPDNETQFDLGQIAVRYRPWRHLEIEFAIGGGNESTTKDGYTGDRELSESLLALRWRFNAGHRWNWWLMGGMGAFSVTSQYATEDEKNAATQSTLQFGVGLERRWHHFALQVEMRAVGVAPNDSEDMVYDGGAAPPEMTDATGTAPKDPPAYTSPSRDGWKGGQTTIGASYYF